MRKGDGGARGTGNVDPAEAKKRAEEKLKAELARLEARKKRKEERKAARKAERERLRAAAIAAAGAKKKGRRGSAPDAPEEATLPEEEEISEEDDDYDDSDDDEEARKAAAEGAEGDAASAAAAAPEEEAVNDKTCSAVGVSCDGTLLAVGCTERLLSICDMARPNSGPLVQFLALGEVSAVAIGPGATPWARGPPPETLFSDKLVDAHSLAATRSAVALIMPDTSMLTGIGEEEDGEASSVDSDDDVGAGSGSFAATTGTPEVSSGGSRPAKQTSEATWDAMRFHASTVGDGLGHLGIIMALSLIHI